MNDRPADDEQEGFLADLAWLPSRLLFRDRVERAMAWADRHGARMAVLFLQVDEFEKVRARIGGDAADELLRDLASRLVAGVRKVDTVSRTRTAEYAIMLPEVDSSTGAGMVGEKLLQLLDRPFDAADGDRLGASVGVAVYPDHALTIEGLLIAADAALQHAKADRPGEVVVYANGMARRTTRERETT